MMDNGIEGITIEHLNNLRKQFDCYYSHIFIGMYGIEKMDHKLVNLLIWSVTNDQYLPPKEKVLEYQAEFDKEKEMLDYINKTLSEKNS